ncbi:bifunctional aconitate hydratase 2/2-methylisocitrate dehydratase [Prochlorococcus marinus str. MU1404]|uniref:bifunctional aconitate hydratase 2/2-methylisocitrate dehydratase n=1 Tax=Prochlorococcus marinus TaxID=1219 RepID=UPI001ADA220D|nr:bifunctional aconitate hydratase 2/2-methylisocitrate dehydratase [Prochlorococcus marinus]MBO8231000.1 bifunctional aconitate hydratase 2/2-methylisocitrate dehydratase [Prochlorococcus marinus XMU1404]MBW3074032.1 bifunctional aconitate hydratase 2/2-methylisocitrate dehydratase [Prochlorococcus marinus str. MU1404]MCR8544668.1 bifunctional aconitate hydratase 2/2-methylisocitrate dehydratase [Prochlorococcus marinus CUG1432]
MKNLETLLKDYADHLGERTAKGIPPLPLNAKQTNCVTRLLEQDSNYDASYLLDLLLNRVPPGVDEAAYVKASWLTAIVNSEKYCKLINPEKAIEILGTMIGGYNVNSLVEILKGNNSLLAKKAAEVLKNIILVYDSANEIYELSQDNIYAKEVIDSWANAEWFKTKKVLEKEITCLVFKVDGETNTDDLSPAVHATTRPDIPMHALAMLEFKKPDGLKILENLKKQNLPIAYVGDVVGTGSSRKSAINSLIWHIGEDIPYVPNKRTGGIIIGSKIAPIFFNTAQDSGALPIEADVSHMKTGDVIKIFPYEGIINKIEKDSNTEELISKFDLYPSTITDEIQAGGRINLMIGRSLTDKIRNKLDYEPSEIFIRPQNPIESNYGFTQAQKIVGKACGLNGVRPGTTCEPIMTTVGSQDTTGPMTRDELKELACLGFTADLVMQSFCHTAAYPKPVDLVTHKELPDFISQRGGIALKPGDGIIHSWLNRMLIPDSVGTGGDSHTRFPLGISFPGGSGIVAFAAAIGSMPLNMPESVLVKFKGELLPGITLRDLVNAIPLFAIRQGLLTVEKTNKKNIFNGKIMEIEGLPNLKLEQAFELTDATAERSCAGSTILLSQETVQEYLRSNVCLLEKMIESNYEDSKSISRRINDMKNWLKKPTLIQPDPDAQYEEIVEIDLAKVTQPIVACPNDPDNVKEIKDVANTNIDEVFIGSCMTNIGHYRAAAKVLEGVKILKAKLWICPPTKMDEETLKAEGYYKIFENCGARLELPGCSLCMGNQARVDEGSVVFSTSTRNFDNRLGKNAQVFLGSAELAAVCALLGKIPEVEEYQDITKNKINPYSDELYRYLQFDEIHNFSLSK